VAPNVPQLRFGQEVDKRVEITVFGLETGNGVELLGIDANCHGPLSQGGFPFRAIWHNEKL